MKALRNRRIFFPGWRRVFLLQIFLILLSGLVAGNLPRALNGIEFQPPDSSGAYSFLAAGHLLGNGSDKWLLYPAGSFLANTTLLANSGASFFVSLGDMMRNSSDTASVRIVREVMSRLRMPFLNAAGNHDVVIPEDYEKAFGATSFSFDYANDRFIFLDLEDHSPEGEKRQLELLQKSSKGSFRNLFVFTHRVAFATLMPELEILNARRNAPFTDLDHLEYYRTLSKVMEGVSHGRNVYWIAGDVGASWSYPAFYHEINGGKFHLIAIGIGDTPLDQVLQVKTDPKGIVRFELIPLSGRSIGKLEDQGLNTWEKFFSGKPPAELTGFGPRVRRMLTQPSFYIGIAASLVFFGGLFLFGRFRKGKQLQ